MKSLVSKRTLSARREVANTILNRTLKANHFVVLVVVLMITACAKGHNDEAPITTVKTDSIPKPKIDVKVNKRYDEKGNMIGFDSTYTSYYSNITGDTARMDSLMGSFDQFFKQRHSSFFGNQFDPLFFNDSLRYPDFFHNDYFMKRYELNDLYMRDMMQRMDSIKNTFYRQHRQHGNALSEKK